MKRFVVLSVSLFSFVAALAMPLLAQNAPPAPQDTAVAAHIPDLQATPASEMAPPGNPAAPKGPLAVIDGDMPGVTAEILELKRTAGNTLTLKFAFNNGSEERLDFGYSFAESNTSDISNVGGVHLIDAENKKKYFVVRDSNGKCLCSSGLKAVEPGKKVNLWAKFPAPPPGVSKVTVEIPHFMPAEEVPIS